jgi:hypothetical protein
MPIATRWDGRGEVLTIQHRSEELLLPTEVFTAWRQPKFLDIWCRDGKFMAHIPLANIAPRAVAKSAYIRAKSSRLMLIRVDQDAGVAVFKDAKRTIPDGTYLPANYDPMYLLMRVDEESGGSKASGNAQFWEEIVDYHEHRPVHNQMDEAHATSVLLAERIREREVPASILELGCGAGRNLWHLGRAFPDARVVGIDINAAGTRSRELPNNVEVRQADVLNLDWNQIGRFDVILTAGFLMHINHSDVRALVHKIHDHCVWHLHFELHGPAYEWDYHRYPRSYRDLMRDLGIALDEYRVFANDPVHSHGLSPSFAHALCVSKPQISPTGASL